LLKNTADLDSGSGIGCLFDSWIKDPGWVKNQDLGSGSGVNNPDHISKSIETNHLFGLKYLSSLMRIPGSRMEKI
jgi:hypothetical protein